MKKLLFLFLLLSAVATILAEEKVVQIYKDGVVINSYNINEIDYIEINDVDIPPTPPEPNPNFKTTTFKVGGVSFTMVAVDGGTFTMGATSEQGDEAKEDEKPAHQVTLSNFFIGSTEVTQALWTAVMGSSNNPSYWHGSILPVEQVSWNDCQDFIEKLNALTGKEFRLPTEAEWEYAARGGQRSKGNKYAGGNEVSSVAWWFNNADMMTHPVATRSSNELGLYDMSGNVWEWCYDWYNIYSSDAQIDPTGPEQECSERVRRGSSWYSGAGYCRVSSRFSYPPNNKHASIGFRLALSEF